MIEFPPSHSDDTQPRLSITQPIRAKRPLIPQWLLLLLIVMTTTTLVASVGLLLNPVESEPLTTPAIKQVVLVIDGQRTDIQTPANTLRELLAEQQISLAAEDAISDDLDTTLVDGKIITIIRARDVMLVIDGVEQVLKTTLTAPYDILKFAQIALSDTDKVWLDNTEVPPSDVVLWQLPVQHIQVKHAVTVTIVDEGNSTEVITTADTVGDVLFDADITLYLTDKVSPSLTDAIVPNQVITIIRAQPLIIQVDNTTIETRVQGGTVIDALAETGVALIGLDYTKPSENTPLEPGMTIEVVRVTESMVYQEEPIPYETVYQADSTLPLDTVRTSQNGQNGVLQIETRVRYENGVEVSRTEVGRTTTVSPTSAVVTYGTQVVIQSVTTADGTFEYWRKLRVYATSYHPAALGGDNVTAIGETLRKGIVGANPDIIPYRTNIYVAGYGVGMIADTGGPRSSPYWIDLGYSDDDYVSWHSYVDIYLLTPVPANIDYLLPTWTPLRGTSGY